jgi:hypothetical protein
MVQAAPSLTPDQAIQLIKELLYKKGLHYVNMDMNRFKLLKEISDIIYQINTHVIL